MVTKYVIHCRNSNCMLLCGCGRIDIFHIRTFCFWIFSINWNTDLKGGSVYVSVEGG